MGSSIEKKETVTILMLYKQCLLMAKNDNKDETKIKIIGIKFTVKHTGRVILSIIPYKN